MSHPMTVVAHIQEKRRCCGYHRARAALAAGAVPLLAAASALGIAENSVGLSLPLETLTQGQRQENYGTFSGITWTQTRTQRQHTDILMDDPA
eukprot:5122569-Amphidinium_carterae.1